MPVTYTLFRVQTTAGKDRYVVGRQSKGEPIDELLPGFRFSESPNGVVSTVRDRPSRILPEETAVAEAMVQGGRTPRTTASCPSTTRSRFTPKPGPIS